MKPSAINRELWLGIIEKDRLVGANELNERQTPLVAASWFVSPIRRRFTATDGRLELCLAK